MKLDVEFDVGLQIARVSKSFRRHAKFCFNRGRLLQFHKILNLSEWVDRLLLLSCCHRLTGSPHYPRLVTICGSHIANDVGFSVETPRIISHQAKPARLPRSTTANSNTSHQTVQFLLRQDLPVVLKKSVGLVLRTARKPRLRQNPKHRRVPASHNCFPSFLVAIPQSEKYFHIRLESFRLKVMCKECGSAIKYSLSRVRHRFWS